jgi:hypothetical protein
MADELTQEQKDRAEKLEKLRAELALKNKELGTAKGLRHFAGSTRGKGSMVIQYQGFDTDSPETLPGSLAEFMQLTGVKDEKELLALAIEGFNADAYQTASDPIAEFVNSNWDKDTQSQFRLVVRNMNKSMGISIEEAANMVRPGIEKKLAQSASK